MMRIVKIKKRNSNQNYSIMLMQQVVIFRKRKIELLVTLNSLYLIMLLIILKT